MNSFIEYLNLHGGQFLNFAWPMLWQSSLLIAVVLAVDFSLARRIRAAVRHALWLVVLVKLLLPPTLALPTGAAWWLFPAKPVVKAPAATRRNAVTYDNPMPAPVFEQESVVRPTELPIATPPPLPAPGPKLNRVGWTLLGCAAVSTALLAWLLCRWWQLVRKVRAASAPEAFAAVLHRARERADLPRGIRLKLVEGNMSPAVCGLFRPVILLPRMLVEQLSPEQLHAVLLHESIHLRRKDIWVNCAQALLQIVYWWHPLVWVANARIRRVREEAVDDAVMLALAQEADLYAATLLDVAKLAFNRPSMSLGIVGIMESRSALRQRVERLMDFRAPRKAGLTVVSLLGIFTFSAVALPMGEGPARVEKTTTNISANAETNKHQRSAPERTARFVPGFFPNWSSGVSLLTFGNVLDDPTYGITLSSLEEQAKAEKLGEPEVAVISGRQVQMRRENVAEIYPARSFSPNQLDTATLVQDGKVLYEMGKFDEAEAKLKTALAQDPGNAKATYYLNLVQTTRPDVPLIGRLLAEFDANSTNSPHFTGPGRQAIVAKLDKIHFENVSYDGLPLAEVLKQLSEQTKLRDPEHKGINFLINNNSDLPGQPQAPQKNENALGFKWSLGQSSSNNQPAGARAGGPVGGAPRLDPNTGLPVAPATGAAATEQQDVGSFIIKMPMLTNVWLADVLDAIVLVSDHPLKYSIQDFAVVFSAKGPETPQLIARTFRMNPNVFRPYLRPDGGVTGSILQTSSPISISDLRKMITEAGVNLESPPGKSFFYTYGPSSLYVKATESDLEVIEKIVFKLNAEAAHSTNAISSGADTATLVQEGKVLYEMGKLGEAVLKFRAALAQDPGNATAEYYINLSQNARTDVPTMGRLANANSVRFTGPSRQAINAKLDKIHLDNVAYDGLPLSEVLKQLSAQCKLRDSEHKGINFLINNNPNLSDTAQQQDVGSFVIKIPGLSDVRLADVLDAIVLVSDHPLKYSIQDFGVMFYAKDPAAPQAFTRTFRADPNTFYSGLESVGAQGFGAAQTGKGSQSQNNGAVVGEVNAFPSAGGVRNSGGSGGGNGGGGAGQGGSGSLLNNPASAESDPQHTPQSVLTSPDRQSIVSKLDHIRIPTVSFDHLRLSEVARQLTEAAKQYDPEKVGVHFTTTTNSVFGEWDDINSVVVHIPSLTDVRLADLLDAVVLVAEKPIKYSILDTGIVFSAKEGTNRLFMRTFRVDPNTFYSGLETVTAGTFSNALKRAGGNSGQQMNVGDGIDNFSPRTSSIAYITTQTSTVTPSVLARAFFKTLGVNLSNPPGKSVFFNDKLGVLFVKATESDLDTIERALQVLNTVPPQVQIKTRFYAVPKGTLDLDKYMNATNSMDGKSMGILTSQKTSEAMQAVAASKDSEILGEPEVTVISGRQVQMRTTDVITVVTNLLRLQTNSGAGGFVPQTQSVDIGPIVDVVPYVLADGYTINLAVIPAVTEFLGYRPLQLPDIGVPGNLNVVQLPTVLPKFTVHQLVETANVWDGQTLVIRMNERVAHKTAEIDLPKGDSSWEQVDKDLYIFVTATVVDSAGNRVHSDNELPFAKDGTPSQPAQPSQPSPIQSY